MPKMTDLPLLPASSLLSKFLINSRLLISTFRGPIPKRRNPHLIFCNSSSIHRFKRGNNGEMVSQDALLLPQGAQHVAAENVTGKVAGR